MGRVKIVFPDTAPLHQTSVPVRIGDVNYGGHLGNDAVLSIVHEARMQTLATAGFTELDCGGAGLIMADAAIAYKAEAFYGDMLRVEVFAGEISARSFAFFYRVAKGPADTRTDVAHVQTGMVTFDYAARKSVGIPPSVLAFLTGAAQK